MPQISIHRGVLQMALLAQAQRRIGAANLHTGHRFVAVDDKQPVTATFERSDGSRIAVEADLFVGADGIHSALRRLRYPDEGLPRYGGRILWRATSRARPFLTGATMIMAGYQDVKFVAYPIAAADSDGLQLLNWIAELTVDRMPERENWNKEGDKADFAGPFADWNFGWLDVPQLIADAGRVFEFPLVDRDPLPAWSFGATTLLGDAAHPMYPIGSNGASQGILDADALVARAGGARRSGCRAQGLRGRAPARDRQDRARQSRQWPRRVHADRRRARAARLRRCCARSLPRANSKPLPRATRRSPGSRRKPSPPGPRGIPA